MSRPAAAHLLVWAAAILFVPTARATASPQRGTARGQEQAPTRPSLPSNLDSPTSTLRPPDGRLQTWFGTMDLNGDAWLSLRETAAGLNFDRGRFKSFDLDRDGRFDLSEYREFYVKELQAGRVPPAPRNAVGTAPPSPHRDPLQLRIAFDRDLDRALDLREFATLLASYGQARLDSQMVFQRVDTNGDLRLDVSELARVSSLLDPVAQNARSLQSVPMARSLRELFGARVDRGSVSQPPQLFGPIPPFWRLDLDGDGYIEDEDLRELQGRLHLAVSVAAVMSTLDLDGDGQLSLLEFRMSMDANVKPETTNAAR